MKKLFRSRRKGFTVLELCLALVLLTPVLFLATNLIHLSSNAVVGTEQKTVVARQDAEVVAQLNETVRETAVAFTIPKLSFVQQNFTTGWDYFGLMEDVHIPAAASRNGRELNNVRAVVYIEYAGSSAPSYVPETANLLHTPDGYFVQHVLSHDFKDVNGIEHSYSLEFLPTDPTQKAAQSITYDFHVDVTNSEGDAVGDGKDMDIKTMLTSLNALQVVYQGSRTNPAVAIAFRSDFLPTHSTSQLVGAKPTATVTMVLDLSGSMTYAFGSGTRVSALKETAIRFVEKLSANDQVNVVLIPFATLSPDSTNYEKRTLPTRYHFNAARDKNELIRQINSLYANGSTNVGDGLRHAHYQLNKMQQDGVNMGKQFLILMTDGEMIDYCVAGNSEEDYKNFNHPLRRHAAYYVRRYGFDLGPGTLEFNPITNNGTVNYSGGVTFYRSRYGAYSEGPRDYMKAMARKITDQFDIETFLISLADGMPEADRKALQEAFDTDKIFDVDSLTKFETTFEQINQNINQVMWAFEGPRI